MDELPAWVVDDAAIAGPIKLLRRVPKFQVHDGRFEKSVFEERERGCGLSVTIWQSREDLEDIIRRHEDFGVICVRASVFRELGAVIARAPLVGNLNHCEVFPRMTGGAQKKLRNAAKWVRYAGWVLPEHRGEIETFDG